MFSQFTYVLGDMNYRINSDYEYLHQRIEEAQSKLEEQDWEQLRTAFKAGHFVGYQEYPITFLPTYKCDPKVAGQYLNKKNQSPSYTDRILEKANTCDEITM